MTPEEITLEWAGMSNAAAHDGVGRSCSGCKDESGCEVCDFALIYAMFVACAEEIANL